MTKSGLRKLKLPDSPGVYQFVGSRGNILYIGKATSLRDRVKSYFSRDIGAARSPAIVKMVREARTVKTIKTDSVLEALILEANLIKKHQPIYNTREKDDKSFNYVVITKEDFPRAMVVRGKDLAQKHPPAARKYLFGPFPQGFMFKEAMKLIHKLFPFYDTPLPVEQMQSKARLGKLRFNRALGLHPPEGTGRAEYARTIRHIRLFFEGKKAALLRQLEREMRRHARKQEFEKADRLKRTIFGLKHIQDVSLLKREVRELGARRAYRIEAYDVAHTAGRATAGVMVVVENGEVKKSDYRKFRVRGEARGSDTTALKEVLERRFTHKEWPLPSAVVLDGGKAQLSAAQRVLGECGRRIPVVSVVKDARHRPREILGDRDVRTEHGDAVLLANSEAHRFALKYHRTLRRNRK